MSSTALSFVNTDLKESVTISVSLNGISAKKISGDILTAPEINSYNDFAHPEKVYLRTFDKCNWKQEGDHLEITLSSKSIVTLILS